MAPTPTPISAAGVVGQFHPPSYWQPFVNPMQGLSTIFVVGIKLFFIGSALSAFGLLAWGAFDWINSGGEKEAMDSARKKMTNAVVGLVLVIAIFTIFNVVSGDILGIIRKDAKGNWYFGLPSINTQQCLAQNQSCTPGGTPRCCSPYACTATGVPPTFSCQ